MPSFGSSSKRRLATTHEILQELCTRVVEHHDITILTGHRGEGEQTAAFVSGVSTKQWPLSKHNRLPSMAVDVAPWPIPEDWGNLKGQTLHARNLDWKERAKFYETVAVFRFAWQQLCDDLPGLSEKYRLRSGADWNDDGDYRDQSFDDLPHLELVEL